MKGIDIPLQQPPEPEPAAEPEWKPEGDERGDPRLRALRVWLRFIRTRFARLVFLPELSAGDAQELRQGVRKEGELTRGYMLMCALSAGIATLGLLQSSTAVVIGAMLISPLMAPIAALGFGFASIDGSRIRQAVRVVAIGAGIGILTSVILTWMSPIRNATPEILARTEPTLLDLAVALFSGVAGGYATVIQKGGTAIGVAIATALMPPLAVVGYGLGVLQLHFALGALLLFLTNLAAITFSFAVIARLSGAARPLFAVEWKPRFVAIFVLVFLVLAIPLSMTLVRITHEASVRTAASALIAKACGGDEAHIAQLDVNSPLFGSTTIDALVIAPTYSPNAEDEVEQSLSRQLEDTVVVNLQQVQAADFQSQTRAMVDAAMERTVAGIAADVPPFDKIRASVGLPTRSIWTNPAERRVYVEPVPAPGWTLADYMLVEQRANGLDDKWNVRIIPPAQPALQVALSGDGEPVPAGAVTPQQAIWAIKRWGVGTVSVDAPESADISGLVARLKDLGVATTAAPRSPAAPATGSADAAVATIGIYGLSPTEQAAAEQRRREAQRAAAEASAEQSAQGGQ